MYPSSELIEALRRRQRRSLRPERAPGEFPDGWRQWLAAMRELPGRVRGAPVESILAILAAREPRLPPAAVEAMGRWQAFASLWRQEWHPASRDERSVRVFSTVATLVLHVLFTAVIAWLMYARFLAITTQDDARGDDTVQVEFIGEGTPAETGGGAAQSERNPSPAPAAASAVAPPAPASELPTPSVAAAEPNREDEPAPEAAQPLQVTETPVPDSRFTLPPTRDVTVPMPALATPELTAPTRVVDIVELPAPPRVERPLPQRTVTVPDLRQPPADVVLREIPAPLPQVRMRPVPSTSIEAPVLAAEAPSVQTRAIPDSTGSRSGPATTSTDASSAAINAAAFPADASAQGARQEAGTAQSQPGAGRGTSAAAPGATPGARRADDWGDSTRNRPGGQAASSAPGLFNRDGSPRLAGSGARVGGGLPPGTITEDYEKIDRMGTWLKRPPIGYEATRFDRFWIPHETLLEEWVRRSIKEVLIPIPGTGKTVTCKVALLALGGACAINDPNLVDVEATARKPPDVPFKRELQEDQGALADPPPLP